MRMWPVSDRHHGNKNSEAEPNPELQARQCQSR
jgi:hypothetical protein